MLTHHAHPVLQGETVPYIICIDRTGAADGESAAAAAAGTASGKGLAQRAYHIDEVRAPGAKLEVDAAYYLSQQVSTQLVFHELLRWGL